MQETCRLAAIRAASGLTRRATTPRERQATIGARSAGSGLDSPGCHGSLDFVALESGDSDANPGIGAGIRRANRGQRWQSRPWPQNEDAGLRRSGLASGPGLHTGRCLEHGPRGDLHAWVRLERAECLGERIRRRLRRIRCDVSHHGAIRGGSPHQPGVGRIQQHRQPLAGSGQWQSWVSRKRQGRELSAQPDLHRHAVAGDRAIRDCERLGASVPINRAVTAPPMGKTTREIDKTRHCTPSRLA